MKKTLYRAKRGSFKIEWHRNVCLFGTINESDEFIVVLFQLAFIFQKPDKRN